MGNRTRRETCERERERERERGGSSDTVERLATGKQNVTITICARSARGKINDLTLSAGTSAPSQAAIAYGRGARWEREPTLKSPPPLLNEILPAEIARSLQIAYYQVHTERTVQVFKDSARHTDTKIILITNNRGKNYASQAVNSAL